MPRLHAATLSVLLRKCFKLRLFSVIASAEKRTTAHLRSGGVSCRLAAMVM